MCVGSDSNVIDASTARALDARSGDKEGDCGAGRRGAARRKSGRGGGETCGRAPMPTRNSELSEERRSLAVSRLSVRWHSSVSRCVVRSPSLHPTYLNRRHWPVASQFSARVC